MKSHKASINSCKVKVEVPLFPTTIPAAAFDISADSLNEKPTERHIPKTDITVSPAPETSKTVLVTLRKLEFLRCALMACVK